MVAVNRLECFLLYMIRGVDVLRFCYIIPTGFMLVLYFMIYYCRFTPTLNVSMWSVAIHDESD